MKRSRPGITLVVMGALLLALGVVALVGAEEPAPAGGPVLINLDVKGGDIAEVMRMLGGAAGVDIILEEGVTGTVPNVNLRDKTVEEALCLIAQTRGYQVRKFDPTTYLILPANATGPLPGTPVNGNAEGTAPPPPLLPYVEIEPPALLQGAIRTDEQWAAPRRAASILRLLQGALRTDEQWIWDKIVLTYVDAAAAAQTFGGIVLRNGEIAAPPAATEVPGPAATYQADPKMLPMGMAPPVAIPEYQALLVYGTQEAIAQFREILAYFDKPQKPVEIEAKFVEVEVPEGQPDAIDWFVANGSAEFYAGYAMPNQSPRITRFRQGRFEPEFQALLRQTGAQLTNAPRVTARNNLPATVEWGTEVPWVWVTVGYDAQGNRSEDRHEDTVSLRFAITFTPRILDDDSIVLDLEATGQRLVGAKPGPGDPVPDISNEAVFTRVRIPDGDTIVIAGFPSSAPTTPAGPEAAPKRSRTEHLIFITSRIIREVPVQ